MAEAERRCIVTGDEGGAVGGRALQSLENCWRVGRDRDEGGGDDDGGGGGDGDDGGEGGGGGVGDC